ncbi:MAG: ArsR family transcriptional regulator [Candidatus Hermodarchaeota archaeon]
MTDTKKIKDKLKKRIEFMKLLSSVPRLRILLLLLIYRKLSLAQLSKLLGRTKATVTHHLKKFDTLGIIKTSRKDSRGSIDAKLYELEPDFFDLVELSFDKFQSLEQDESKELLHYVLLRDKWMFDVFRNILIFANRFYQEIDERFLTENSDFVKQTEDFYFKSPVDYNIWFLTEDGKNSYDKAAIQFIDQINKIIKDENKKGKLVERPYCILNLILPLKKLSEFDLERKRIMDFLGS